MADSHSPATDNGSASVDAASSRPLRADARRNRDRVLEAARAAFAAEGSDASLDEIARIAGVGPGTVYRHFATKEALFEAVVLDRIGDLDQEARELTDDTDPGRAFSTFTERLAREGAIKRDLVEALSTAGGRMRLAEAPVLQELVGALAALLRRAQQAGAVRDDLGVDDVMAILTGAAYAISYARADEDQIRRLLAVMGDGMQAQRPEPAPQAR